MTAMTIELVKILEAAQDAYEESQRLFEQIENETDDGYASTLWAMSCDYDGICTGYLGAYNILTGRDIPARAIKNELAKA